MTAPKSAAAVAREAREMATNATQKADELGTSVKNLEDRYSDDVTSLQDRLGRHVKVSTKKHDRLERLVADVGRRLEQDHDAIFELNQRFARMNELVGDGLKLNLAASIAGFTKEEIREILAIQADDDLSDSAVITGMVNQIGSIKAQLNTVVDTLADTRGMVNGHDERINNNTARITGLETAFKEVKESVSSTTVSQSISKIPLIIGLIVGVVTFFVANAQDDVSNWRALGFAVAIGAITAGILSFFAAQIVKISEKRKSSQSTSTSGESAEADTSNTRSSASDDRTQVVSAQDQTEHQPDLAPAGSRTER